jgi:hypothetical protein
MRRREFIAGTMATAAVGFAHPTCAQTNAHLLVAKHLAATAQTNVAATINERAFGFPDGSNTGVPPGTVLRKSGDFTVSTAGQTISGLDVTGTIRVRANNVVIKNCRINCAGAWGIDSDGYNANVIDCEIFSNGKGPGGVLGQGGTYQRLNIYAMENGIVTQGDNQVLDCYIHDLGPASGGAGDAHIDGISIQAGSNTVVRHCRVESWDTSCIFVKSDFTEIHNITVDNNLLINTPGKKTAATVYSVVASGKPISGVSFTNNVLEKGRWYYASVEGNTVTWTNNIDYHTGAQIRRP